MITAEFANGKAQANLIKGEKETYHVTVYSDAPKHDYQCIMDTISWGSKQGFAIMSTREKRIVSVTPEYKGKSVKQFRFVKVDE